MATLYNSTITARRVVIVFLIIGVLIAGLNLISYVPAGNLQSTSTATYYMEAAGGLGGVPVPNISTIQINDSVRPKYSIEGVYTLALPDSLSAYVYKVEKPSRNLTEIQDAKKTALFFGFDSSTFKTDATTTAQACVENVCEWEKSDGSKKLVYDILKKTWKLTTEYTLSSEAKAISQQAFSLDQYRDAAIKAMVQLGFNQFGLEQPFSTVIKADLTLNGEFVPRENGSFALINLQRSFRLADLRDKAEWPKLPSNSPVPNFSAIEGKVYGNSVRRNQIRIIAANGLANFARDSFEFDFTNSMPELLSGIARKSSYWIVRPEEAWTNIQKGEGFLVDLSVEGDSVFLKPQENLAVREFIADAFKTEIGYFEPEEWTGFITPIYIFRGGAILTDGSKANFTYYVDAIKRL